MKRNFVLRVFSLIEKQAENYDKPLIGEMYANKPLELLLACILSLRTKDAVTEKASRNLFSAARTPEDLIKLNQKQIEKLIYPVGFYRNKAKAIKKISATLLSDFSGSVPEDLKSLLSIYGVGRKTANLVLGLSFKVPAICVDTHVHRICNRLGWMNTKTPLDTELGLKKLIPKDHWIKINSVFVTFGQNICVPVSPFCSKCIAVKYCKKIGVKRHR